MTTRKSSSPNRWTRSSAFPPASASSNRSRRSSTIPMRGFICSTNGTPISTPLTRSKPKRWSMRLPLAPASSKSRTAIRPVSGSTGAAKQSAISSAAQRNAEHLAKAALAVGGNFQRARIADARDPAEFEAAAGERRAERAGQMQPAFAPVDTGPAERAAAALDLLEMDAEVARNFSPACVTMPPSSLRTMCSCRVSASVRATPSRPAIWS